jgi:hypothetical protein
VARRVGENGTGGFSEPTKGGVCALFARHAKFLDGGTDGKAECHVPPSPLAQRLCSKTTLVPRFALERRGGGLVAAEERKRCITCRPLRLLVLRRSMPRFAVRSTYVVQPGEGCT